MSLKSCGKCKFFDAFSEESDYGRCRVGPPQVFMDQPDKGSRHLVPKTFWPSVNEDKDWCGEWEERK